MLVIRAIPYRIVVTIGGLRPTRTCSADTERSQRQRDKEWHTLVDLSVIAVYSYTGINALHKNRGYWALLTVRALFSKQISILKIH